MGLNGSSTAFLVTLIQCVHISRLIMTAQPRNELATGLLDCCSTLTPLGSDRALSVGGYLSPFFYIVCVAQAIYQLLTPSLGTIRYHFVCKMNRGRMWLLLCRVSSNSSSTALGS